MNEKLDKAFDELEFAEETRKANYLATQKEISTGVTDGTMQMDFVNNISEYTYKDMLRDRIKDLEDLTKKLEQRIQVLENQTR